MGRLLSVLCLFLLTACFGMDDGDCVKKQHSNKQQSFERKEYYCE